MFRALKNHIVQKERYIDTERSKYIPEGRYFRNNRLGGLKNDIFKGRKELYLKEQEGKYPRYRRLDRGKVSITIMVSTNSCRSIIHPIENRTLTIREKARIQSFSDTYIFTGNVVAMNRQVGIAVPPMLAFNIAKIYILYSDFKGFSFPS